MMIVPYAKYLGAVLEESGAIPELKVMTGQALVGQTAISKDSA